MSRPERKEQFGAIPMRAFSDKRLTRTHLSVLGVVSHFDRFSRNGSGCYAEQTRIARLAGCTSTTVSKRVADLVQWGYLNASRQKDRRRIQYRVEHQMTLDSCPVEQVPAGDSCPVGQVSDPDSCPVGQTKRFRINGLTDSASKPGRMPSPPCKKDSAEAGSRTVVRAPDSEKQLSEVNDGELWAYQAMVARALTDGHKPDGSMVGDVQRVLEGLYDLERDRGLEMAFENLCCDVQHASGLYDEQG